MKIEAVVALVGASLASVSGNMAVMEIVRDGLSELRNEGFFRRGFAHQSVFNQPQKCKNNKVTISGEDFPCEGIDFLSFLSHEDLSIEDPPHRPGIGISSADIWGWVSPTGREITFLAMDNGQAVIDTTDPVNPCIIAKLPSRRVVDNWGDNKVYKNVLYHVKDTSVQDQNSPDPTYGIEVYDLEPLDQLNCHVPGYVPLNLFPNFVFREHGRSHNLVINPESGHLYSVGSQKCAGGLMIIDLNENPLEPKKLSCADQDGYTHDAQCLTYDGPDTRYTGKEICFAYNEDTLTIWDVSDPINPRVVSLTYYDNQVYSHQGWVNNDLTKVLLDDELDEWCNTKTHPRCDDFDTTVLNGNDHTTTNVFDIRDLEKPIFEGAYQHPDIAVDHNLYVWGVVHRKGWGGNPPMKNHPDPHYAYMANYLAGVKVVDIHSKDFTKWTQAGYFDIAPDKAEINFAGAWSTYMHPSGALAVSSIERGMFMLKPNMAFTKEFPQAGSADDDDDGSKAGLAISIVVVVGLLAAVAFYVSKKTTIRKAKKAAHLPYTKPDEEEAEFESKHAPPKSGVASKHNPMFVEDEAVSVDAKEVDDN